MERLQPKRFRYDKHGRRLHKLFERGQKRPEGAGRVKGKPNRTTRILKEAILMAAEQVGEDRKGRDGLVGYLRNVAKSEPKAFVGLLGRVLPLQITGDPDRPLRMITQNMSANEAADLYAQTLRELSTAVGMRLREDPLLIEHDEFKEAAE